MDALSRPRRVFRNGGLAPGKYTLQTNNPSNGTIQGSTEIDLANDGQDLDLSAPARRDS